MRYYDLCKNYNQRRLQNLQDALTTQKWKVFSAIPALLHYDFAFLPGSVDGLMPHGFERPCFSVDTFHHAGEFFPELRDKQAPPRKSQLAGLYAMGSIGSAFFTSASDIDFWIIHESKSFQKDDWQKLERKLHAIENWAMITANLEIHFYIHERSEIERATFSYDKDNAGEFGPLLKEEFLRTAIHIAGFEPSFWKGDDPALEFGKIPGLSTEQYLAACLIQLEKAFTKPFKSALKIALTRRLAARPDDKLPAEILWERVGIGVQPDPYILLLEYIWDHFKSIDSEDEHSFIKQILYLKTIAEENSPERLKRNKDRIIAARFQAVGKAIDLDRLDSFFNWPFIDRIKLAEEITRFIQDSIRDISTYIGTRQIDPSRLRRIMKKVMLRRTSGDVLESITFSDVPSKGEQILSFILDENNDRWLLSLERFSGRPDLDKIKPERTAATFTALLAFTIYNNLLSTDRTDIRVYPSNLSPRRLGEIIEAIIKLLRFEVSDQDLEHPAHPEYHLLIMEQYSKEFDSRRVTLLSKTSWGLIESKTFSGKNSFMNAVQFIILLPKVYTSKLEIIIDPSTGPDAAAVKKLFELRNSENNSAEFVSIIKDTDNFLLIAGDKIFQSAFIHQLLFQLGQIKKQIRFVPLLKDDDELMIQELFAKSLRSKSALFRFKNDNGVIFFLTDNNEKCDSWFVDKEDAPYNLRANYGFISSMLDNRALDCFDVEYRRGIRDMWNFSKISFEELKSSTVNLSIEIKSNGFVSILFGNRILEEDSLDDACTLLANLIRAARKVKAYYPPYLTGIKFPIEVSSRLTISDTVRMKREIEGRIANILQKLY